MGTYSKLRKLSRSESPASPRKKEAPQKKARLQDRQKDIKTEILQDRQKDSPLEFIRTYLEPKPVTHTTFRYPVELLERLDELQYRVKRAYKTKVTKTSVLVTALAYIIWDFEQNGRDSVLYKAMTAEE